MKQSGFNGLKNPPKAVKLSGDFRCYEFRVMNLASPNVMGVLRTRYDMIALLHQTAPKVHHNYAKRIITDNSFCKEKREVMSLEL